MKQFVFFSLLMLAACSSNRKSKGMIFNLYGNTDSIVKPRLFKVVVYPGKDSDSIVVTRSNTSSVNFRQSMDNEGIYRFCDTQKVKTHSFWDTLVTSYCNPRPPFLNENVVYKGQQEFTVNSKQLIVYHYVENTGIHTEYDSYFLKNFGPICYYSFDADRYIYCDSVTGFDITTAELLELKHELLSDTTFFSRALLKKLMPNYYRTKPFDDSF